MGKSTNPPTSSFYLFVWSGEQDQGWDQKELGKAARAPPPQAQTKATDGIPRHHLLSQLSTHKPKELASLKTKGKTQNVKRATVSTCSQITIFFNKLLRVEKYCWIFPR